MAVKRYAGAKGKCDVLFSKIIRSKGYCENCGDPDYSKLQCAHIISRRYSATRTDLANAWSLCWTCHRRFTDWPYEHSRFITRTIGTERYEELRQKAETPTKMDWDIELLRLREIAKEMEL
jgi:5-methylcytosine-specific restriction endonuclease McrA